MSKFSISNFPNKFFNEVITLDKFKNQNYIQNIISSFHDYDNLYFISKYYDGNIADIINYKWNENEIKFFSACLIQIFITLRKNYIIHRDIHYWNLMLDEINYIVLIDFHLAKDYKNKDVNYKNEIGSPSFCAPEIIQHIDYDYNSDYYRLGVMIYHNILKEYPNKKREKYNLTDVIIDYNSTVNLSYACIDFINKLLVYDKKKRIGFKNVEELKNHIFFHDFDWENFKKRIMKSPFKKSIINKQGLCKNLYKLQKKVFVTTKLMNNNTFKNILLSYDKSNEMVIKNIIK